jgi:hypothetical protein
MLIANLFIAEKSPLYLYFLIGQSVFYTLGIVGILLLLKDRNVVILSSIGSFFLVLCAFTIGIWQSFRGKKIRAY